MDCRRVGRLMGLAMISVSYFLAGFILGAVAAVCIVAGFALVAWWLGR